MDDDVIIYEPVGCPLCGDTGYAGRIGVYEMMPVSKELQAVISKGVTADVIEKQALKEGLIDIFMEAGAIVMNPNCSVCWGSCQGVIGENEVLISTGTRNFKGRAGHPSSKVYLGSAATVTASAITGKIALASEV